MAEIEEGQESNDLHEEPPWEERTLHLLPDSKIDQEFSDAKKRNRGGKKHKIRYMKRPMAIPEVILELLDENLRENALRCLSTFLLEKRVEDPENYYRTGFLLYNSCCTMAILLQEVLAYLNQMVYGCITVRTSKRLANVLTLFQSIAANIETRQKFVDCQVPNYLIPLIHFETSLEVFENVRAVALSIIGILCQAREPKIIQWAIGCDMIEVCQISIEIGNELSKVIGMHILEAILQDQSGIYHICSPWRKCLLNGLMEKLERLVLVLAMQQDFSPRLLFHIIRCYILLCNNVRGFGSVADSLPHPLMDGSFDETIAEFPLIGNLLHQLLLTVGKVDKSSPAPPLPHES